MIETMTFRLKAEADEAEFLNADARLQAEFAYQQPGLARRTTARGNDGAWIVIDLWSSAAAADECATRWDGDELVGEFMSFVDPPSVRTERYTPL